MSIPTDAIERGCAANFPQPVDEEAEREAQFLVETVYYLNCHDEVVDRPAPPLDDIVYRSSHGEQDILQHVFRWDVTGYDDIFQNGFHARRQQGIIDAVYYNLDNYVHHAGRPVDSTRTTAHAFVSTTLDSGWTPQLPPERTELFVYRYEIYAPGGIWVAQTLGARYQFPAQDEVCFVAGIAPQYIRSAQRFRLYIPAGSRHTRSERVDNVLMINAHINPQSHPYRPLPIRYAIDYYMENGRRVNLVLRYYTGREKRQVSANSNTTTTTTDWYAVEVANIESYINAAFRSSRKNEAYLFMRNEYVLLDYAPHTKDDKVLNGPLHICDGFPSLTGTAFAEHGIDCAFGSYDTNEAFIFCGNLCAQINYAPHTTDDKIIKGPMTITAMFPFFKGTVFESSVDAAFDVTTKYEAYLFKDNQYALINYNGSYSKLIAIRFINQGFPSLKNTIFESGIDAAFASHYSSEEAYLFKGDSYALINYAPGTTDDYLLDGVKNIIPNWPSLHDILPRKNHGLDVHVHTTPAADRDHDEL